MSGKVKFVVEKKNTNLPLMETKIKRKVTFKAYDQNQILNVPVHLEELIPSGHLVRIVDGVVERIDMAALEQYYPGGGSSPYHPRMMIKVWIYGYIMGTWTSRKLARAIREQLPFMWLAGCQQPNFKTLSEFRGNRMEGMIDLIFKQVLWMLVEEGYVDLKDLYVDGSKWEANANRHKVVWAKNTKRYKEAVMRRIEALLERIEELQRQEDLRYGAKDLPEVGQDKDITVILNSEQIGERIAGLQEMIRQHSARQKEQREGLRELNSLAKKLEQEQEKLEKYEKQEKTLQGRNSYSKTDEDATMMRMKDERLLPAFNIQGGTSRQFVVNYTVEQAPSDSGTLIGHMEKKQERFEGLTLPDEQNVGADSTYGSEENYAWMEEQGINAYVKYPMWYQEHTGELVKKKFRRENWPYDSHSDTYTCPNERKLLFTEERIVRSQNGYEKTVRFYTCESCEGCPFAGECKKSEHKARTVQHSPQGEIYKAQARERLDSTKGQEMRSTRPIEVESTFGDIKHNMGHRRFLLRGLPKVYIEFGLLALAHNLRKVYCRESGCWAEYYARRASRKAKKASKRA